MTSSQWNNYIFAGRMLVAMRVEMSNGTVIEKYLHLDNLSSVATITDTAGNVSERLSYDAWGKRRFPNGQDDPTNSITSATSRGYIGQEQVADVGLVNLNARIYDPFIGRFISPDTIVESPYNPQDWNRYSYVLDNPTSASDPGGACFLGCFWKSIFKAIAGLFRSGGIGSIIGAIIASFVCGPSAPLCFAAIVGVTTFVSVGIATGKLSLALKAGLFAAVSAFVYAEVPIATAGMGNGFLSPGNLIATAIHAAVGCGMAIASHQSCGSGALAAGVPQFAGPLIGELQLGPVGNFLAATTLGGLASVAGGGKFANGAATAAFAYLASSAAQDIASGVNPIGDSVTDAAGATDSLFQQADQSVQSLEQQQFLEGYNSISDYGTSAAPYVACNYTGCQYMSDATQEDNQNSLILLAGNGRGPIYYCQNVECGAPTGGVVYPLCPQCNDRLKNGGDPILLENGRIIRVPIEPGKDPG